MPTSPSMSSWPSGNTVSAKLGVATSSTVNSATRSQWPCSSPMALAVFPLHGASRRDLLATAAAALHRARREPVRVCVHS